MRTSGTVCLDPSSCYQFVVTDSYGDGITGSGRGVQIVYGGDIIYSRRSFGYRDIFFFGGGCSS